MAKEKGKEARTLGIIAIILFGIFVIYLLNNYLVEQKYIVQNTIAVINDTTGQIVWVGASQLCVPGIGNTHVVSGCMEKGSGYVCNDTYYNVSMIGISCGSESTSNYSNGQCGNTATLKPLASNQAYICASVGRGYGLLFTRNGAASNFTLDSVVNDLAPITIRGWCSSCAEGGPVSYNYTLTINQTANTACATGTSLQLLGLNDSHALFLETEFKHEVCFRA